MKRNGNSVQIDGSNRIVAVFWSCGNEKHTTIAVLFSGSNRRQSIPKLQI